MFTSRRYIVSGSASASSVGKYSFIRGKKLQNARERPTTFSPQPGLGLVDPKGVGIAQGRGAVLQGKALLVYTVARLVNGRIQTAGDVFGVDPGGEAHVRGGNAHGKRVGRTILASPLKIKTQGAQ